jgi:hypothetical protein
VILRHFNIYTTRVLVLFLALGLEQFSYAQPAPRSNPIGGFAAIMGSMGLGIPQRAVVSYNGALAPASQGSSVTEQHRLHAILPVSQGEQSSYAVFLNTSSLKFGDEIVFPRTTNTLRQEYYKFESGLQFSRRLANERTINTRFSIGSASDQPFADQNEMTFSASASYDYPGSESSHWIWTVFISNNNPIANYVPIPGFMYFFRRGSLIGMVGLPVSALQWAPVSPWNFSLSLFGPSVNAEVSYGERKGLQKFLNFNWGQQSFLRHDRKEKEDRLYVEDKKLAMGLRSPLSRTLSAELLGGFLWDRKVYEGPGFNQPDRGRKDLRDSWFAGTGIRSTF